MIPVTIKQKVMTVATDNSFHLLLSEMGIFADRPTRWMLYVREEMKINNCYHRMMILYVVPALVLSSVLHYMHLKVY